MKTKLLRLAGAACVTSVTFAAADASAQQTGFALNRFEPSERGSGWFSQDTLDLRGHLRPAIGIVGDYGYKPLVIYDLNGDERSAIVRHQMYAHLGGSLVLVDRVRIGVSAPVALYQDGEPGVVNGATYRAADEASFGDVRLAGDVRLIGNTTDVITIAAGLRAWAPTGSKDQYTGDGRFRFAPQVMIAGEIPLTSGVQLAYAGKLGTMIRLREYQFAGSQVGSEIQVGGAAGLRLADRRLLIGPEVYFSTVYVNSGEEGAFFKTRGTPIEGILGAHYDVVPDVRVGAGVGTGLSRGYGAPQFRGLLSVEWAPAYKDTRDRDNDGIVDTEDACPETAGVRTDDPKTNGCPLLADRDKDTILDTDDACADIPGVKTNDPKTNGCPPDKDKDGIPDVDDACPELAGVRTDDPKTNGCPSDRDKDGIFDAEDACPEQPGPRDPDAKKNGCPPPADTDKDTIIDAEDACPQDPGPKNSDPKKNGCPLVILTEKEVKIFEQVKFKTNSAEILKESDIVLTAVAGLLKDHPEIKKVRIEGHTDNKGQAAYNKQLSQKRAASVQTWLTTKGAIDKARLVNAGFGQELPIDTNETDDGRQNNRRVQFVVIERDDKMLEPTQGGKKK